MSHFLAPILGTPSMSWHLRLDPGALVLASRVHTAFDARSRRVGLLQEADWPEGSALVIAPSQAIHTIGMRFPIDVLFVDRGGRVLSARRGLVPWRLAASWRAFAVIELPAGTLGRLGVADASGHQVRVVH
jgi:uncharacterized protein